MNVDHLSPLGDALPNKPVVVRQRRRPKKHVRNGRMQDCHLDPLVVQRALKLLKLSGAMDPRRLELLPDAIVVHNRADWRR